MAGPQTFTPYKSGFLWKKFGHLCFRQSEIHNNTNTGMNINTVMIYKTQKCIASLQNENFALNL